MIFDLTKFKPIQTFGISLLFIGAAGVFIYFLMHNSPNFVSPFKVFFICMVAWHLLTGVGIIIRKIWGFYLLKFYLYILMLGFPIGTKTAKKMFKYMEENQIKDLFFNRGILL